MKFGKQPHKHDPRTFQFARYATALPTPPATLDFSPFVSNWPVYGNDAIGDCTCAAAGHMVQIWTATASKKNKPTTLATSTIEKMYSKVTGWPRAGDNGANELDILNYWRTTGLTKTHKLYAFAQVDAHDHNAVRSALYLFGGLYIGFGISDPTQLFDELNHGRPWTPEKGQVTEGHAVNMVGYDANTLKCVTWGRTQQMTWAFWDEMVDECWVLLPQEWAKAKVDGFDFATLQADLSEVTK